MKKMDRRRFIKNALFLLLLPILKKIPFRKNNNMPSKKQLYKNKLAG